MHHFACAYLLGLAIRDVIRHLIVGAADRGLMCSVIVELFKSICGGAMVVICCYLASSRALPS